jgi:hypothetical protein
MILLSYLLLVAGASVVACITPVACIQTVAGILVVLGVLLVPDGLLSLVSLLLLAFLGVASISAIPFELAVAGGPPVIGFLAVDGVLAAASIPADTVVFILAGGFTYWTVQ